MSIEQLLILLLLIALPLLERLVHAMRARRDRARAERVPVPSPVTVLPASASRSREGAGVPETRDSAPRHAGLALPPAVPPIPLGRATVPLRVSQREPPIRRPRPDRPPPSATRPLDPPRPLQRWVGSDDLSRAVVLIAILGPCRASEPHSPA